MKRSLAVAAFLATTALTPTPARADPISAIVTSLQVAFAAGSAGAGLLASAGVFVSALASTVTGSLLLSVGLSALSSSLAPSPNIPKPSARMVNFAQPISYAEWVFGRTRKGGPIGFTGFQGKRRWYVPILAAHPVHGVHEHWIDEWKVGVDGTVSNTLQPNLLGENDGYPDVPDVATGYGRIDFFDGQTGQSVHPSLKSEFVEITDAHDFKGLAGAVCWAKKPPSGKFSEVYPRSREWAYTPVIDGNDDIYDPRDGTRKYTSNAALVLAYWLTELLGQQVDWDEVKVEADICDEQVINAQGVSQNRWEINGTVADDMEFEQMRAQMAAACDAFLYERTDGKVGFKVGRWTEPAVTLTEADFLGLEISEGRWGEGAPTEVEPQYVEPDNKWREAPAGTWVEATGVKRVTKEPQLFMVTNHNQVSRLAKRIAKTSRAKYDLRATLFVKGYDLIGQRFVHVTHAEMGIDETFEVGKLRRVGPATFELEAVSSQQSDFAFDALSEEPPKPEYKDVDSEDAIDVVTGVSATATGFNQIEVDWTDQDDIYRQQVRVTNTNSGGVIMQNAPAKPYTFTGLVSGAEHEVEVRNVQGIFGTAGPWSSPPVKVTPVANSTAPAALDAFSTSASGSGVTVNFTAPNDPNYFGTRIWRSTDSTFANAALVRTEYGIPSSGDTWADVGLAADTYYYWAAPINESGVEGPLSGPSSETVT